MAEAAGKVAGAAAAETALWGAPDVSGGDDKDDKDEKKVSTAELFAPANRRAVTIGTGLFFLQQMSGVNAIVYFSSAMFVAAGVESAVAASVAVCATNVVATILSGQALDRLGRKPLLRIFHRHGYQLSGHELRWRIRGPGHLLVPYFIP